MSTILRVDAYDGQVQFEEDVFGLHVDNTTGASVPIRRFTWRSDNNITVQVITYGATLTSVRMPDRNGALADVVMGFDDIDGYKNALNPYFGATVGRVANRVGFGKIRVDGAEYEVAKNLGEHQLHGGFKGFDKVLWEAHVCDTTVTMSYLSVNGEEGYPGDVLTNITFAMRSTGQFTVDFKATTSKPTFVNLTNHSYFNLAGHNAGARELYKHVVSINADRTTDVDENSIPSGKLLPVANTIFDLQIPKVLGDVIHKIPGYDGYDHNFCINKASEQGNTFIARVSHPPSGRSLEVYSNQPGVQFYVSNSIPEDPKLYKGAPGQLKTLKGKGGCHYYKHGALCLETQNYPDAINHDNFPKAVLYPGETYHHSVTYKFLVDSEQED